MDSEIPQCTSAAEATLIDWFHHSGGVLDERCAIAHYEGMGRGFKARQNIAKDEVLFTIPRHILLNTRTSVLPRICESRETGAPVEMSPAQGSVNSWRDICEGWTPLILCIMWERWRSAEGREAWERFNASHPVPLTASAQPKWDEDYDRAHGEKFRDVPRPDGEQEWRPYLDLLPTQFDTPMFWPEEDIKELEATNVIGKVGREDAEKTYQNLVVPYIRLHPAVFFGTPAPQGNLLTAAIEQSYSVDIFHRMGSSVLSRSFHVEKPKGQKAPVDINGDTTMSNGQANGDDEEEIEEGSSSDSDDDDQEDVADISLTPVADLLNARFEHDNVSTPHACGLRIFAASNASDGRTSISGKDASLALEARARRALDAAEHLGGEKGRARLYYKALTLEMRATKDIAAGEQIFNTYADPPNSDLLRRYGHCDEPNGNDVVELEATTLISSSLHLFHPSADAAELETLRTSLSSRVEWWCASTMLEDVFVLTYLFPPTSIPPFAPEAAPTSAAIKGAIDNLPEDLLIAARLLCMSESAYAKSVEKDRIPSPRAEAVEAQDDGSQRVPCKLLLHALRARLAQYPTTADDDEKRLYGSKDRPPVHGLVGNERKACIVRLGEKRVLLDIIRVLSEVEKRVDRATAATNGSSKKRENTGTASGSGKKQKR